MADSFYAQGHHCEKPCIEVFHMVISSFAARTQRGEQWKRSASQPRAFAGVNGNEGTTCAYLCRGSTLYGRRA